jgi:hypothetical protein
MGEMISSWTVLAEKPEPFGSHRLHRRLLLKWVLKIGCEGMDRIKLAKVWTTKG